MSGKRVCSIFCLSAAIFFLLGAAFSFAAASADYFDKSGKQVQGRAGQSFSIDFSDGQYKLRIDLIEGDSVTVYLGDEGPKTLKEGETGIFAMKDDGTGISVEIIGVMGKYANIRARRVEGIRPVIETPVNPQPDNSVTGDVVASGSTEQPKEPALKKEATIALYVLFGLIVVFLLGRHIMRRRATSGHDVAVKKTSVVRKARK